MCCYVSEASVLVFLKVDPCGTQCIVLLVVSHIQLQSSFPSEGDSASHVLAGAAQDSVSLLQPAAIQERISGHGVLW